MFTFVVCANESNRMMPTLPLFSPSAEWGTNVTPMRWRHSVLFPIVLCPLLATSALSGCLLLLALSSVSRSPVLWYSLLLIAAAAPVIALLFGCRLCKRLQSLLQFLAVAPQRDFPPSLPVWNEDEVGALERGFQQMVSRFHEDGRALQSENKKFEAVLQSMAEGVVVVDPTGNVVLCNHAAQNIFGLSPTQEWRGRPIQAFSRHPVLPELFREVANRRPGENPITR